VNERAGLPQIVEKFVAKALALPCVRHQSRDIDQLDWNEPHAILAGRVIGVALDLEFQMWAFTPDMADADIWLDSREWVIGYLGWRHCGGAEKCGFSHIWFTNYSYIHNSPPTGIAVSRKNVTISFHLISSILTIPMSIFVPPTHHGLLHKKGW